MKNYSIGIFVLVSISLVSCEPMGNGVPQKQKQIIRNLPTEDRQYLLEPLEASLDDVRSIIENNQSLFESDYDIDSNGIKGNVRFKLSGRDTSLIYAFLSDGFRRETHQRFLDDKGELFFDESEVLWLNQEGDVVDKRAYKLYFEEGKELISSYGKVVFNERDYPSNWVTIQPTKEEVKFVLRIGGIRLICNSLALEYLAKFVNWS
ncbi:hypothetical protein N9545_05770 [Salibacteraceae bacterium]|nr:hypothetical protein [Salibacteraceae bacterium]MDB9708740.1 hypothetical protein [Salibacteraceae bacterium]